MLLKFRNITELRAYIQNTPENAACLEYTLGGTADSHREGKQATKWTGTESFEAADRLLLTGDDANAAKLQTATAAICSQQLTAPRRVRVFGYSGSTVNISRYLNNEDRVYNAYRRQQMPVRAISVCVNAGVGASWTPDVIAETAAKILSQIIAIERAGVRVEIYLTWIASHGGKNSGVCLRAKAADETLNINSLAYMLLNASFLRRHWFALQERNPEITDYTYYRSFGSPVTDNDSTRDELQKLGVNPNYVTSLKEVKDFTPEQVADLFK